MSNHSRETPRAARGLLAIAAGLQFVAIAPLFVIGREPFRGWISYALAYSLVISASVYIARPVAARVRAILSADPTKMSLLIVGFLTYLGWWGDGLPGLLVNLWIACLVAGAGWLLGGLRFARTSLLACLFFLGFRTATIGLAWYATVGPEITAGDVDQALTAADKSGARIQGATFPPRTPEELAGRMNALTDLDHLLRYSAADSRHMPTIEQLCVEELIPVPMVRTDRVESESRRYTFEGLKSSGEAFGRMTEAVERRFASTRFGVQVIEIFLGRSYGLHQLVLVLTLWSVIALWSGTCSPVNVVKLHNCREGIQLLGLLGTVVGMSLFVAGLAKPDPSAAILQQGSLSGDLAWKLALAFNKTATAILAQIVLALLASARAEDAAARDLWQDSN